MENIQEDLGVKDKIIVALDSNSYEEALRLVNMLSPHVHAFQVGFEAIHLGYALELIDKIRLLDPKKYIMYDGQFLNTACGVASVMQLYSGKVNAVTLNASAGVKVMRAAIAHRGNVEVFAHCVFSTENSDVYGNDVRSAAFFKRLHLAKEAGVGGIICTVPDLICLSKYEPLYQIKKIAAAIRPEWAPDDDQEHAGTPSDAILYGADALIIGRPITHAKDSVDALKGIQNEISRALIIKEKKLSKQKVW